MWTFFGKSDPFVHVFLQDSSGSTVGEMKTSNKTDELDPDWGAEPFNFACDDDKLLEYTLLFKVMDTGLGPDVELGEARVPLKLIPLLKEGDEPSGFHFSLGIKRGHKSLGGIRITAGVMANASWF